MKLAALALFAPCALAQPTTLFTESAADAGIAGDAGAKSFAVAFGDINGDDSPDILVTNSNSTNVMYLSDGQGNFTDVTVASGLNFAGDSRGAVFADVNADGHADIFVSNVNEADCLYINDGHGVYTNQAPTRGIDMTPTFGQGASFGDIDNDGDLDLIVANFGQSNKLYINDGSGMFVDATAHAGLSDAGSDSFAVVFADVDGDGDNDLFVSNAQTGNKLYLNQQMETGELGFLDVTSAAGVGDAGNARAASFVDVDSDGDLDLFVANVGSANSLYINNGKGVFTDEGVARGVAQSGAYTQGVQVADFDNSGDLDLITTNAALGGNTETTALFVNDGTGHFFRRAFASGISSVPIFGQGAAYTDLDGDGDLDVFVSRWGGPNQFYVNNLNDGYSHGGTVPWLKVRPVGKGNYSPTLLGSEVRVYEAGTHTLVAGGTRLIDGGSGFCSQNMYDAFFGLGFVNPGDKFDVEVKQPGQKWATKATHPELGDVEPNKVIYVRL